MIIESELFFKNEDYETEERLNTFNHEKIIFICKSNIFPNLLFHLKELRSLNFNFNTPEDQFPKFLINLISNLLKKKVYLDPEFVKKIVQNNRNYYFLLEENQEKIKLYLDSIIKEHKMKDLQRKWKLSLKTQFRFEWKYFIFLINYLKDIHPKFSKNKFFVLEMYCTNFKSETYKAKNRVKEYSKISYYFSKNPNKKYFNSVIRNNKILENLRIFLFHGNNDRKKRQFLEKIMEELGLCVEKNEDTKGQIFQRTQDSFLESFDLGEGNYERMVCVNKLGQIFENIPRNESDFLEVYIKV
jgi:hypothetical protein